MPGVGELIVIFVILGAVGFWLWTLVDCATKEPEGYSRVIWILIIVLANTIGALLYLLVRRPRRKKLSGQ